MTLSRMCNPKSGQAWPALSALSGGSGGITVDVCYGTFFLAADGGRRFGKVPLREVGGVGMGVTFR